MNTTTFSRRQFLGSTLAASAALPFATTTHAQGQPAKWTRRNLNDPKAPLDSYQKAVTAMLKLKPEDPNNWYRNAFVHILDCPHHNWWFLPWHRSYIGWFEITCRKLSGDPDFALPYWDWTTEPSMPTQFYGNVLDPTNALFLQSQADFIKAFKDPVSKLWQSFTKAQTKVLAKRSSQIADGTIVPFTSAENLWSVILDNYPTVAARSLSSGQALPKGTGSSLRSGNYVIPSYVTKALKPVFFENTPSHDGFGSDPAQQHSMGSGAGKLESGPHDQVHNDIGGPQSFMPTFLSPVDPIFFMHHCNLDRLWDVWTRKQQASGGPIFPQNPTDLKAWNNEPFLFYVDSNGKTLSETSKDGSVIGRFSYNYTAGFGEQFIKKPMAPPLLAAIHAADINAKKAGVMMASADLMLPSKTLAKATGESNDEETEIEARVTFAPGVIQRGTVFQVRVNSDKGDAMAEADDPSVVGEIRPFGSGHDGPMSFTVPIGEGLKRLNKTRAISDKEPLKLHVTGMRDGKPVDVKVEAITVSSS